MKEIFKRMFNPEDKNMIPDDQSAIDYLLLKGGLQVAGVDSKTGEFLYAFTPKIKDIMPELYHEHINGVNAEIMNLWEKGFLDIDFFSDNPIVNLSDKAFDISEVSKLDEKEQWSINEIKRLIKSTEL